MARSRKVTGACHLCGIYGPLSFEHVPPRAAFNDRPVLRYTFEQVLNSRLGQPIEGGTVSQKGAGAYTLCGRCNNNTGSWYGKHFVAWCHQGMEILQRTGGKPSLIYLNYVFPLSIIKQVATMFFSLHTEKFREKNQELEYFVLDRERRFLSRRYRFFVYFNIEGNTRYSSTAAVANVYTGWHRAFAELTYPPYGYILTFGDDAPHDDMFEITHFARFPYEHFEVMELRLPVLPTHGPMPGDYRDLSRFLRESGDDEENSASR
jgi:hypothetical protein